jgi:hypothetical protein
MKIIANQFRRNNEQTPINLALGVNEIGMSTVNKKKSANSSHKDKR